MTETSACGESSACWRTRWLTARSTSSRKLSIEPDSSMTSPSLRAPIGVPSGFVLTVSRADDVLVGVVMFLLIKRLQKSKSHELKNKRRTRGCEVCESDSRTSQHRE